MKKITLKQKFRMILKLVLDIKECINAMERIPRNWNTGELLYCSEIHTIEAIGDNRGINVTALANKMSVTKGAISQCLKKLESKDFVKRLEDTDNEKEVMLDLTKKGKTAYKAHTAYHDKQVNDLKDVFSEMSEEQFKFLESTLSKFLMYAEQQKK